MWGEMDIAKLLPGMNRKTLAVDLDGTLAGLNPNRGSWISAVHPEGVRVLQRFKDAGWQIILSTVRPDEWLLRAWCDANAPGIFDGINCNPEDVAATGIVAGRPYADVYLDDKAWPNVGSFDWDAFAADAVLRGWIA